MRAAALRPINVLMLVLGGAFFAFSGAWWVLLLTLVTYATLVFLAARDPLFEQRVLEGRPQRAVGGRDALSPTSDVPPERRARWLPRGETRDKVEEALVAYRRAVRAIEESDDVTREVLSDAVPKLHAAADRLVDAARNRETAAEEIREQRASSVPVGEERAAHLRALEAEVSRADAEISGMAEQFLNLRAGAVRASVDSGPAARAKATELNMALDEMNLRLEALNATMSPPETPHDR